MATVGERHLPADGDRTAHRSPDRAPVVSLSCQVFRVPTDQPEADGTLEWTATTVVLVEARAGGCVGTGWTYASEGCRAVITQELTKTAVGMSALDVPRIHESMVRACRNVGRPGIVASAISAVDIALWDLKARILGVALCDLFGRCRDDVPVYGSGGFTTYDEPTLRAQLQWWVGEWEIPRVKIKIGESWGTAVARDLDRVALSRVVIGDDAELYVDANGGYTAKQAVRVGRHLENDHGVTWFEEPVSSDDLAGLRHVRSQLTLDVAAGEYGYDETYFDKMVAADAVDCIQADVTRCGGYTSWLRVAAIAGAHGLQVSGHCAPNLHAHVAAGVPNLRHVEYFHDHSRLDAMLFDGVLDPHCGGLWPEVDRLGHGMTLREAEAAELRVS
jgi:L-alanine-DL-glutamate epimerase-like enolase superfamily enzyme